MTYMLHAYYSACILYVPVHVVPVLSPSPSPGCLLLPLTIFSFSVDPVQGNQTEPIQEHIFEEEQADQ